MMPERWRKTFLMHTRSDSYLQALEDAKGRILQARTDWGERTYLAFSGGKDSLVCLDLVMRSGWDCRVGHYDFGRPGGKRSNVLPQWMEEEIEQVVTGHYGTELYITTKGRNFGTPGAAYEHRGPRVQVMLIGDGEFWIMGSHRHAAQLGCTSTVVGLRSQESLRRRRRVSSGRWIDGSMPECWPISEWSEMDVWAHIVAKDLPYSSVYDRKAEIMGTYMGIRMRSLFDDGRKGITDGALDGVLWWRDRPGGRRPE